MSDWAGPHTGELLTLRLRYKQPDDDESSLIEVPLRAGSKASEDASADFRFAAAVAAFVEASLHPHPTRHKKRDTEVVGETPRHGGGAAGLPSSRALLGAGRVRLLGYHGANGTGIGP